MSDPRAIIEITADSRALGARLREAGGKLASFAASSARVVGRYGAASAATLGGPLFDPKFYAGLGSKLKGGAMVAGAALVASGIQVRDFEEGLVRLQINADASASQMDGLRRSVRGASSETAIGSQKILEGIARYVDLTGDFAGATRQVRTFARVAQATNSDVSDVASTAAALQDALKIEPQDMEAAFSALTTQGKKGSVTMREMARELSALAPTMSQFKGGTGLGGLRQLGAAMQIINKRYNSASESATAFQSMAIAIQSRAGKLDKAGIDVFDVGPDGTKRLKDLFVIIDNIGRSDLMKDPGKLIKTLGRAEAVFPIQQLVRLRQELEGIRKAGEVTDTIDKDLKTYQASKPGKLAKHWNDTKEMGQALALGAIDVTERAVGGWSAAFSGDLNRTRAEASALEADTYASRRGALQVMTRYAMHGLVIDPMQAQGVDAIETDQRWRDSLAQLGLGPGVLPEERDNLRNYSMVEQADGSRGGVDAAGNVNTISAEGMAILNGREFKRAMTEALRESGLTQPLQVAANAVHGATRAASAQRRRP